MKKSFLLRVDREVLEQLQRWATDEFRSMNGHIEYLLRDALRRSGRGPGGPPEDLVTEALEAPGPESE